MDRIVITSNNLGFAILLLRILINPRKVCICLMLAKSSNIR